MANILYVDDEPSVGLILEDTLSRAGHRPLGARNVVEALQVLARESIDLIISDYRMPGLTGLEFLSLLQREGYDIPLIMLTGYASIEHAVAAIKAGAIDYITKPVRTQQLELAVEQALEFVRLRRENESLRREVMEFRNERQIIGESLHIRRILQTVAMVAPTRATVLLQGESGTGKELFARAIHDQSDRRDKPFIKLNCAALPEGLIESELFGHERGAFTGAVKRVEGAFERAHGGRSSWTKSRRCGSTFRPGCSACCGTGVRACGRDDADSRRRAGDRDDEPQPGRVCGVGTFPPGPLLSIERGPDRHPVAARAPRRHPDAGVSLRDAYRERSREGDHRDRPRRPRHAAGVSLAGERARVAARRGAGGHPLARRLAPRAPVRAPAHGDRGRASFSTAGAQPHRYAGRERRHRAGDPTERDHPHHAQRRGS
ncbi:MAG: sigma-54-dependent Fis family transcriptional regulator [Gemmatimonadetes bacterium]|nr:sigma-54-dependent Fis family transcriptional regulator [Gemmatimonadota bacterium]